MTSTSDLLVSEVKACQVIRLGSRAGSKDWQMQFNIDIKKCIVLHIFNRSVMQVGCNNVN